MKKILALGVVIISLVSCVNSHRKTNDVPENEQDTLSGKYVAVDFEGGSACPIAIIIKKKGIDYSYHIVNGELDTVGKVTLSGSSISLEGLKWSSYLNDDEENETVSNSMEFEKDKDTLLIQNYGNAMNNYTKLACGAKFIKLVKQP